MSSTEGSGPETGRPHLRHREGDQPLPVRNDSRDIQSMVIDDIRARRELGISRYATALQAGNGRDALRDLYEELTDAVMYTRQLMAERGGPGVMAIAAERHRQIAEEGYTAEHDAEHDPDDMIRAAIAYALNDLATPDHVLSWWPWGDASFKGGPSRVRDLAKAGALLAAAIDRLSAAAEVTG